MPYAIDTVNGDGSKVEFDVTFDFISRDDVRVTRIATDGVRQLLTVIASGSPTGDEFVWESNDRIKVGTAPAVGEKLETKRDTPEDQQVVKWADGSYIISEDLNTSDLQLLYLIQELSDAVEIIGESTLVYRGAVDLTVDNQPPDPQNGDFYINIGAGTVLPSWAGIAGDAVTGGERILYNGELRAWEVAPPPKGQTIIADEAPALGARGQIWWNSVEGKPYIWYEDADSAQWVQLQPDTAIADSTVENLTVTGRVQGAMESFSITGDNQTIAISNNITVFQNSAVRTGTIFALPALSSDCSFKLASRGELVDSAFTLPAGDSWGNDPGTVTISATSGFCLYYVAGRKEWYYST